MARPMRRPDIHAVDRENNNPRKEGQLGLQPVKSLVQRSALSEVGNKLQIGQCQQGVIKKSTTLIKKTASVIVAKRAEIKKVEQPQQQGQVKKIQRALTLPSEAYSSKELKRVLDIDTSTDPQLVCEYVKDIFDYMRSLEAKYKIKRHYMTDHNSTPKMRAALIDWMVAVHKDTMLLLETLHVSIAILDRYLQMNTKIGRDTLQLVGTTALYIAAKYEEICVPDVSDFVWLCDNIFSKGDIFNMEQHILKHLDFELGRPLSLHFLRRYSQVKKVGPEHHTLGKYLIELALMDYDLCHVAPSIQSAGALCLSVSILNGLINPAMAWCGPLRHYSTYAYSDIMRVVVKMACVLRAAETSTWQAIRAKYSAVKYGKISHHPRLKGTLVRKLIAQSIVVNMT